METKTLNLKYSGRRNLNDTRKRTLSIFGIILFLIGIFGLYNSNFTFNPFWYILGIGGIFNILQSQFGKELIKENHFISISGKEIEYKNSFKKSKKININDLSDLRIKTAKVDFVHHDKRVESYDFSVFQRQDLDHIYSELETIKANLNQ